MTQNLKHFPKPCSNPPALALPMSAILGHWKSAMRSIWENVKARELSEQWVRAEPDSPAAQFALSEVLLTIEGNMPRALYHLHRASN